MYQTVLNGQLSAGFPDEVYANLEAAAGQLAADDESPEAVGLRTMTQSHRDWVRATHVRGALRQSWNAFFEDWDILLCPQMPTTAFPHDHTPFTARTLDVDGRSQRYGKQVFWAGLITAAYLPSTVFPTGLADDGLPIGLQAAGAEFGDRTCIEFARLLAEEFGGFQPPAGYGDDA